MANRINDRERYDRGYEEEQRYGRREEQRGRGTDYGRSNRESSNWDSPSRGSGSSYNDSYSNYGNSYNEPYRSNYGGYDYGRIETSNRYDEPYGRGYENRSSDPYYRNRSYRGFNRDWEDQGQERGLWERAGDEVRSWFGDEEAERRRRQDEIRSQYAGRGPKGYKRSDERIREDVNERLTGDYYLDAHDIDVSVSDGTVTLSGRVDSRNDKRRAEDLAERVSGVIDVTNQLRVGQDISMATTTGTELTGGVRTKAART